MDIGALGSRNAQAQASGRTGGQGHGRNPLAPDPFLGATETRNEGSVIFLDTNVLIYASDPDSPFHRWSFETIARNVPGGGAIINPIVLAEICVGEARPEEAARTIRSWGIEIMDLPAACAESCARAYGAYRAAKKKTKSTPAPATPLPDFFIGAHADLLQLPLATADVGRYRTYFPGLKLLVPQLPRRG
jgi:predicted nucleic acid-binding protein